MNTKLQNRNRFSSVKKNLNAPTDEGYKIFIKTQFGKTITVYGLNENSTMIDIQKKLEIKHGSAMSKSGLRVKPPDGIKHTMWFSRWGHQKNTKLIDLGIKPNDSVIWNTVYSKYKSEISDKVSDEVDKLDKRSYKVQISLTKILNGDKNEIKILGELLSQRGWCKIKYPKDITEIIHAVCKKVDEAIKKQQQSISNNGDDDEKNSDWKQIFDGYGFINFKDYKQVLRIVTGSLMDKFQDKYPNKLQNDLKKISQEIDKLSLNLLNMMITDKNLFNFNSLDDFNNKCKETNCNITMLNGYNYNEEIKCGLLDFVSYENLGNKQEKSKYQMIKENAENVGTHTDPGLFSLSFLSTAPGLQLYDIHNDCWRKIDNDCGVLWCGEAASTISDGKVLSGIHRVMFEKNKPRFTAWYELSVDSQLTKAVIEQK